MTHILVFFQYKYFIYHTIHLRSKSISCTLSRCSLKVKLLLNSWGVRITDPLIRLNGSTDYGFADTSQGGLRITNPLIRFKGSTNYEWFIPHPQIIDSCLPFYYILIIFNIGTLSKIF